MRDAGLRPFFVLAQGGASFYRSGWRISRGRSAWRRERRSLSRGSRSHGAFKPWNCRARRPSGSVAKSCRWTGAGRRGQAWLHAPRAVRRRGRDYAVQLSAQFGLSQGRAGAGGRKCRHHQARQRHAADCLEARRSAARRRRAALGGGMCDRAAVARLAMRCAATRGFARFRSPAAAMSGEHICHVAGLKRVTMELGSNAPLIVMDDADLNEWPMPLRSRASPMPGRFAFPHSA